MPVGRGDSGTQRATEMTGRDIMNPNFSTPLKDSGWWVGVSSEEFVQDLLVTGKLESAPIASTPELAQEAFFGEDDRVYDKLITAAHREGFSGDIHMTPLASTDETFGVDINGLQVGARAAAILVSVDSDSDGELPPHLFMGFIVNHEYSPQNGSTSKLQIDVAVYPTLSESLEGATHKLTRRSQSLAKLIQPDKTGLEMNDVGANFRRNPAMLSGF